jgi:GTP-binding protein
MTIQYNFLIRPTKRYLSTKSSKSTVSSIDPVKLTSHLNPSPEDYGRAIFADKCSLTIHAGSGGHGCISFLREKFIAAGPPNGGDGGSGGNIYIQAVKGETSLHKLARRGIIKAGRGRNGQGKSKGGQRGEDILLQVPIGTVVRETSRFDPVAEAEEKAKLEIGGNPPRSGEDRGSWKRDKWILYPSAQPTEYANAVFPALPRARKSSLSMLEPQAPILLDLSKHMEKPMLLVAGASGGLGNPHFVTKEIPRPIFATKGDGGVRMRLEFELKLLADVGFVGMPNAGKSTLLRALSKSRARVGDWAFTTLQPNLGTVVLDDSHGRAKMEAFDEDGDRRTQFSIADIPGLIPDAHLDRGLGLGFLRHIERARVLAFVVDLSSADVVWALKTLWNELGEFEKQREQKTNAESETRIVSWHAFGSTFSTSDPRDHQIVDGRAPVMISASGTGRSVIHIPPISSKPWFVVATKADLEYTQENYTKLKTYLDEVATGKLEHPGGTKNRWRGELSAIPVSAIQGNVDQVAEWTIALLKHAR